MSHIEKCQQRILLQVFIVRSVWSDETSTIFTIFLTGLELKWSKKISISVKLWGFFAILNSIFNMLTECSDRNQSNLFTCVMIRSVLFLVWIQGKLQFGVCSLGGCQVTGDILKPSNLMRFDLYLKPFLCVHFVQVHHTDS